MHVVNTAGTHGHVRSTVKMSWRVGLSIAAMTAFALALPLLAFAVVAIGFTTMSIQRVRGGPARR